jgi:hypothetical protein
MKYITFRRSSGFRHFKHINLKIAEWLIFYRTNWTLDMIFATWVDGRSQKRTLRLFLGLRLAAVCSKFHHWVTLDFCYKLIIPNSWDFIDLNDAIKLFWLNLWFQSCQLWQLRVSILKNFDLVVANNECSQ